jgi:orotate phosphoribosyltransferase
MTGRDGECTDKTDSDLRGRLRQFALEHGEFELSSGGITSVYVDVRQVSLTGRGAALIGGAFWQKICQLAPDARAVGGMTLGADPLVTATSLAADADDQPLDGILVRKASKSHGTGQQLEAPDLLEPGDTVVAVEDTVTTGNSTLEAVEQLREAGFDVDHALCVVDREAGGRDNLASHDIQLHPLFTLSELTDDEA